MDLGLRGLKALVTGSSRGLGFATAQTLAKEGAVVTVNSRSGDGVSATIEKLYQAGGQTVYGFPGDLADPGTPAQLVEQAVQAMGGLDILITNAGGPPSGPFSSFDDSAWQSAFEVSLMSHVRLVRAALPHLQQSKAASVLTITSYSVKQPIPNLVLSNSIRAATVGLTKTLALELGTAGIRFNSILPAWTDTERVGVLMAARAKANGTTVEEETLKQAKDSPLGRMAQPQEFANAAVFLVSPAASYITGVMLTVDGGMVKGTL